MQEDTGNLRQLSTDELFRETEKGNEDLIFYTGETVQVKGGDFRIKSFGRKMMVLEGLPGTRIRT